MYLGLLLGRPSVAKLAAGPGGREVSVRYENFKDVPVPASSRVSFKASGEIHLMDKVLQGKPLASLSRPRQLCLMMFAHPSRYPLPSKKSLNDHDIGITSYAVAEGKPMYGALILVPLTTKVPVLPAKLPRMKAAATFALGYRGLTSGSDLIVQVIVGHGPSGPWPPLPGVMVASRTAV